jgi:hypothetical protein
MSQLGRLRRKFDLLSGLCKPDEKTRKTKKQQAKKISGPENFLAQTELPFRPVRKLLPLPFPVFVGVSFSVS